MIRSSIRSVVTLSLLFLGSSMESLAQFTVTLPCHSRTSTLRYKAPSSPPTYLYTSGSFVDIGRYNGSGPNSASDEDIYRTARSFEPSLDLPPDVDINSAYLIVTIDGYQQGMGSKTARIVSLASNLNFNLYQSVWDAVGGASTIFDNLTYSTTYGSRLPVTSTVATAYASGSKFNVGAICNQENTNNTNANIGISLEVTYTPKVRITVINSFGGGWIKVDGGPNPVPSGTVLKFSLNSQHQLLGYDQTWNNQNFPTLNRWTNVGTGDVYTQNPLPIIATSNVTYRAEFGGPTCAVTVLNSFGGGTVKIDGGTPQNTGTFNWTPGGQHTLEAVDQQGGPFWRVFTDWTTPVTPHDPNRIITIIPTGNCTYQANFINRYNVNLTSASYIEAGSGGTYKVDDVNVGASYTGTYLQSRLTPVKLEAVPPTARQLIKWSDGSTANPRWEMPTDNVSLCAVYKATRGSSLSSATGSANQRKLSKDCSGRYHLVYSSGGTIWYTMSSDGGATWSSEVTWGQGGTAGTPSVATSSSTDYGPDLYATWLETDGSGVKHLYFAEKYGDEAVSIRQLDASSSTLDTPPTVGVSGPDWPDYFLILYKKLYLGRNQVHAVYSNDGGQSWIGPQAVFCGTPIIWDNPSIAWSNWQYCFATSFNSTSNVNNLYFDPAYGSWLAGSSIYTGTVLSPSQVAVDASGREYYTWSIYDSFYEDQATMVRIFVPGTGWLAVSEIWPDFGSNPAEMSSVSGNASGVGASLSITNGAGSVFYKYTTDGSVWPTKNLLYVSTISCPNLVERSVQSAVGTLATTGSGSPYALRFEQRNISRIDASSMPAVVGYHRRLELWDTSGVGTFQMQLGQVTVTSSGGNSRSLGFAVDTTGEFLRTEPFSPAMQDKISADIGLRVHGWKKAAAYACDLVDAATGQTLATLSQSQVSTAKDDLYHVPITKLGLTPSGTVYLRVRTVDVDYAALSVCPVEVEILGKPANGADNDGNGTLASPGLPPQVFALSEAYPNPFNPSTTLRFDLPSDARVRLIVYDVLGREIAKLAEGLYQTGYHTVTWDAQNSASGLYLARLEVTNELGKILYNKVNKVLLVK